MFLFSISPGHSGRITNIADYMINIGKSEANPCFISRLINVIATPSIKLITAHHCTILTSIIS